MTRLRLDEFRDEEGESFLGAFLCFIGVLAVICLYAIALTPR